ncbi:hypothetical protein C8250_009230 [Streptomyces sp. So13.3]|nr:hypothetical protein [Streptomyces sp. So13.3]QNA72063.1 hypothetical protein C8250_009230 [Streptomyces sp. So13.3]
MEELLDRERELRAAIAGDPFWTTAAHGETSSPRALPALRMGALEQAA